MTFNLENIIRDNIKSLAPYSSARDEYKGKQGFFLDANENPYGSPLKNGNYNRYPDPMQVMIKEKISVLKSISKEQIFLGNGSDEAIDLTYRAFCVPGVDNAIICPPTYGMYEVCAAINDINVLKVPLIDEEFQLNANAILDSINNRTKLIFICCPNNPTGNGVKWSDIKLILDAFNGIVIVDEAYIDFASYNSLIKELSNYKNLIVLQTFSKAWGMAGLRVGMAFASKEIIEIFNKIKPPYNINDVSQQLIVEALNDKQKVDKWINKIIMERNKLSIRLKELSIVTKVYNSEANFLLVKVIDAKKIYEGLIRQKIVTRNRSNIVLCNNCLRISIGAEEENNQLITALKAM